VRDNLLYVAGGLDLAMGGPDIDHNQGLTSKRRSIYLRIAAEKEVEFLKIFDGPAVTECYERHPSVMPQQALAMANSELAIAEAKTIAAALSVAEGDENDFVKAAFERILARRPTPDELGVCGEFLSGKTQRQSPGAVIPISTKIPAQSSSRENLILVLLNHNDFVTVR